MNILVIGSGGREHAICLKFKQSSGIDEIYALPGNAGIAEIATCVDNVDVTNHDKIITFCNKNKVELVFVGPEQPLVDGIVDDLERSNIRVFGPDKNNSRLEGSKDFMKRIASENNIPTAEYKTFTETKPAIKYAKSLGFPCVIKADGLAAGKGVIIAQNKKDAQEAICDFLENDKFGDAGKKIIVEEFLVGTEVSYFVICDSNGYQYIGSANDHKKAGEGGTGPNTGGMGTFTPSPFVNDGIEEEVNTNIIEPALNALKKEGKPFRGILFAGLVITKDGVKLLEFNTRLGDPETQIILPLIENDFAKLINHAVDNKLDKIKVKINNNKKFICVVVASNGYPGKYNKNILIENLNKVDEVNDTYLIHAGTVAREGKVYSNGGRVLNIVASGDSFKEARKKAYEAVKVIDWKDGFVRSDIALSTGVIKF